MVEYALVIGVVVMGIIIVGRSFFGSKDEGAGALIGKSIESAGKTLELGQD